MYCNLKYKMNNKTIQGDRCYTQFYDTDQINTVKIQLFQVLIETMWLWKDIDWHIDSSEMSCEKQTSKEFKLLQQTFTKMLIILIMQMASVCFAGKLLFHSIQFNFVLCTKFVEFNTSVLGDSCITLIYNEHKGRIFLDHYSHIITN